MPLLVQPLPKECAKAAKIFQSFVDSGNNGLDGVVPRGILERAKGFAIFSVVKAGFIVSARAGSGIVIARLEDGSWSAPSAIGTAGMGLGTQAGAEVTDFLIVLNTRAALKTFMSAGSLTLGGNLSIAVGPLGRNGEAIGSFSSSGTVAAMYSYSKTRGLFGGVSLEGSVVVERQDANAQAYGRDAVSVKALLSGAVPVPQWAQGLVSTLESCTGMPGGRTWVQDTPADLSPAVERGDPMAAAVANSGRYTFAGLGSPGSVTPGSNKKKKGSFPPMNWGRQKSGGSYFAQEGTTDDRTDPFKLSNQEYRSDHTGFGADESTKRRSVLSKSDDLTRSMRALALSKPAPTIPNSTSSPAAQQAPTFETHFDSDFVPESTPAPAGLSSSFNGLHPTLASASQPKQPEVDLLDFGDHKPSALDFDPLGPGSRMQYGQSTHPHTHTQSLSGMPVPMPAAAPGTGTFSRPAPNRASSNPFFGLDAFPAPSSSNAFPQSSVNSTSPFSTPALTSSPPPIRSNTFSPTLSSQSIRDIRQNQTPLFGPDPPFAHTQRPSTDSMDELYTPRAPSAPVSYSTQSHPAPTRRDSGGPQRKLSVRPELAAPLPPWAQGRAVALFDFEAVQPGDLSFRQGEVITLLEKSGTTDTWWKGWVEGRTGIFPANFVEVA